MKYPEHVPQNLEMHEEQPRGWFIPESVKRLYDNTDKKANRLSPRVLNAEEMMLLSKINALCKRKEGCTATNRWLAKWWDKSKDWTSKAIVKFEKLGLIKIKLLRGNRRVMWTTFQGDLSDKTTIGVAENSDTLSDKTAMATDILEKTRKKDNATPAKGRGVLNGFVYPTNLLDGTSPAAKLARVYSQFIAKRKWMVERAGFNKQGLPTSHTFQKWVKRMNSLLSEFDEEEVKETMIFFFDHWKDKGALKLFTLITFCDRYMEVRYWMDRHKQWEEGRRPDNKDDDEAELVEVVDAEGYTSVRRK